MSTVLGGYERVSPGDVRESDAFLAAVFPPVGEAPSASRPRLVAADCGAGVGRVTEHLLLRHFDEVDLVEPVKHYLEAAEQKLSALDLDADAPRKLRYLCEPLQAWTPDRGRYDVIWVQWCLGHLTDGAPAAPPATKREPNSAASSPDDFVALFNRCKAGLKRDGLIVARPQRAACVLRAQCSSACVCASPHNAGEGEQLRGGLRG